MLCHGAHYMGEEGKAWTPTAGGGPFGQPRAAPSWPKNNSAAYPSPWDPSRTNLRGGRGAVWADRPAAGGGPESPTPWGRRARRGHARSAGLAVWGACAKASTRPMRAPLRAAGPAASWKRGLGAEAWAGRVGSGVRLRRRRRHAGAGPVAAAGRRGRTGRWSAAALRAPLHGVGGRAGGTRVAQARLRGARVQGPLCGLRDQRQGRSVGPRRGVAAWGRAGAQRGAA